MAESQAPDHLVEKRIPAECACLGGRLFALAEPHRRWDLSSAPGVAHRGLRGRDLQPAHRHGCRASGPSCPSGGQTCGLLGDPTSPSRPSRLGPLHHLGETDLSGLSRRERRSNLGRRPSRSTRGVAPVGEFVAVDKCCFPHAAGVEAYNFGDDSRTHALRGAQDGVEGWGPSDLPAVLAPDRVVVRAAREERDVRLLPLPALRRCLPHPPLRCGRSREQPLGGGTVSLIAA